MKYKYEQGKSIDEQYWQYAAQEGLYNIAVFGHLSTRGQRRKLEYIWKRLLAQKNIKCVKL